MKNVDIEMIQNEVQASVSSLSLFQHHEEAIDDTHEELKFNLGLVPR